MVQSDRHSGSERSPQELYFSGPGIGKSLAFRLADQGLNVILVALPDAVYDQTFEEIEDKYPKQKFIKASLLSSGGPACKPWTGSPDSTASLSFQVETNLGKPGYLDDIKAQTRRITPQIIFCNAGYMLTGALACREADRPCGWAPHRLSLSAAHMDGR